MWQQLHYRVRERERASASITMAKCLRLPVAVFTLPYVAVSQAVSVFVSVSAAVSALESPGQLMYMCCLHAAILQLLQLLFAFVCCSEAFKKFTIQFFLLLIRSHTHSLSLSLTYSPIFGSLPWHLACISNCILY